MLMDNTTGSVACSSRRSCDANFCKISATTGWSVVSATWQGGKMRGKEGGREGGMEGGREGGRERGREEGKESVRQLLASLM